MLQRLMISSVQYHLVPRQLRRWESVVYKQGLSIMQSVITKEVKIFHGCSTVISRIGCLQTAKQCIVFIPGNPGIIEFYDVFLQELYHLTNNEVPVIGIAQAGHSPAWQYSDQHSNVKYLDLPEQIQHKIECVLTLLPKHMPILLIGHSIGAYIALKMLENRMLSKRLVRAILLFPAIEELKNTPNGRFWMPVSKYCRLPFAIVAFLFSFTPLWFKNMLVAWRAKGRSVDEKIIKPCHSCVSFSLMNHALYLAASEMDHLEGLGDDLVAIIQTHIKQLTFYYGAADKWAPHSFYERMTERFPEADIRLCGNSYPHDFVLDSSKEVAQLCFDILFRNE